MHRIAVIGDSDSILGFKALGLDVYPVSSVNEARDKVRLIAKDENTGIIFLTESTAAKMLDMLTEYSNKVLPVLLTIPDGKGESKAAITKLKKIVERALGADILFAKEKEGVGDER